MHLHFLTAFAASAAPVELTILHTNDWQSRLLGFGPNAEYTPDVAGDDDTIGGVARLKTLIDRERAQAEGPVLLLDGGDFTMGTLFHTVTRETGGELQLLKQFGYDAVTLGNHEFDFRPDGLARMISSAQAGAGAPPILATNLAFSDTDPGDDSLKAHLDAGAIQRSLMVERGGLQIGLLGVMGTEAYEVIGKADPITIFEPIPTLQKEAQALRSRGADIVILLSHSGVERHGEGEPWGGEEVAFAKAIPEIDVIVGGHSHTALHEPIDVDGRFVLQAGSEGRYLGELTLRVDASSVQKVDYTLHPVDDAVLGAPETTAFVAALQDRVEQQVISGWGYAFDQPVAQVPRDLTRDQQAHLLGNLYTDGLRRATGADIAVTARGSIRDDVQRGRSGIQSVSDIFRVAPLGIGTVDDSPGYAVAKVWFTGRDLKSVMEFLLVGYQLKGEDYFPSVSGARIIHNGHRALFDRVVDIEVGDDASGYDLAVLDDDHLYSLAATSYIASFLPTVADTTYGLLDAVPRHEDGTPVADMDEMVFDLDPAQPGVQELKAWRAVLERFDSLPDLTGDGLADVPDGTPLAENRFVQRDSWSLTALTRHASWKQWVYMGFPLGVLGLLVWLVRRVLSRR